MSRDSRLRVAVALPRDATEHWHRLCVERIQAIDGVSLVGAIVAADPGAPRSATDDEGSAPLALDAFVRDMRTVRVNLNPSEHIASPDPYALDAVDVIVDLAGVDARWPQHPRFGVWRYLFGDGGQVARGAPGTMARLCRLTPDRDRAIVLHEGWFRAHTADAPGTRSVLNRVAPWCARVLSQLLSGDQDVVSSSSQAVAGCCDARPPSHAAGWRAEAVGAFDRWVRRERWTVGLLAVGIADVMQRGVLPDARWIAGQPMDRYFADPFPLRRIGNRLHVLVEEYRYRGGRGRVSELDIGSDAHLLSVRDRIALSHHVSYPFVFRRDGSLYCIPETARAERVSAFACDPAGDIWRHHHDLLDGFPAVDATVLEHEGRWWLFCTHRAQENQTDLHLFSAPDWLGPWTPHALNPVKSDARSSRPAGACFALDGALYRPAQDCSRRYGGALAINRIVELSARRFREEPVLSLQPSPDSPWPDGVHTINALDNVTVIDGLRVERTRRRRDDR